MNDQTSQTDPGPPPSTRELVRRHAESPDTGHDAPGPSTTFADADTATAAVRPPYPRSPSAAATSGRPVPHILGVHL